MYALIVESPAKCKTIGKYLGKNFKILSSFGHIRALPTKKGSVNPDENFKMIYDLTDQGKKVLPELVKQLKGVKKLYLATDPDREGEAISWHLYETLKEKKSLPNEVHRIVFNQITKSAVENAIKNPREIDMNLVEAQRLRQALDYLVGFNLSPILWKKLPGSKSAGRVQSVALRILCDRENEIDIFQPEEYWNLGVNLKNNRNSKIIETQLTQAHGAKLEKTSIKNEKQVNDLINEISNQKFTIHDIKQKNIRKKPPLPFITSTLQQFGSTNLSFNAKKTMMIAQKLYEGVEIDGNNQGVITYMRTDGIYIADDAIKNIRKLISNQFDKEYLPKTAVKYKKKVKNAQEAHESIRPTDIFLTPDKAKKFLSADQLKLYSAIWKRTVASQMTDAVINSQSINFISEDKNFITYASCSSVEFDGFYRVYRDSKDNVTNPEVALFIKSINKDDNLNVDKLNPTQHFTEPPKRYSEAGLIKKMEELGIGRPSTYATIISVLQDRLYAIIQNKAFIPENRGRVVSAFLTYFFSKYVEYNFTANLEDKLDKVADGDLKLSEVIEDFWSNFNTNVKQVDEISINDILKKINEIIKDAKIIKSDKKIGEQCPKCNDGEITLNISRFGVFLGCTNYPDCKFTVNDNNEDEENEFPKQITEDVSLNKGPYGVYIKYGKKNISVPKDFDINLIDEEFVNKVIDLPKVLGEHNKKEIKLGLGPYGLYLLHNKKYYNISFDLLDEINLDKAIDLIKNYTENDKSLIKTLGEKDGETVNIKDGRYGPYIKYGKLNVAIPKSLNIDNLTLDDAVLLIEKKIQLGSKKVVRKKTK